MPDNEIHFLLSIGANLGDRRKTIEQAISLIGKLDGISLLAQSSFYETQPVGFLEQPFFLNVALSGLSRLNCFDFIRKCKDIESILGRVKRNKWQEREIDIDIILFGDCVVNNDELVIPHPRMHERRFVLVPSNDIASDLLHPLLNQSINSLLNNCIDTSIVYPFVQTN